MEKGIKALASALDISNKNYLLDVQRSFLEEVTDQKDILEKAQFGPCAGAFSSSINRIGELVSSLEKGRPLSGKDGKYLFNLCRPFLLELARESKRTESGDLKGLSGKYDLESMLLEADSFESLSLRLKDDAPGILPHLRKFMTSERKYVSQVLVSLPEETRKFVSALLNSENANLGSISTMIFAVPTSGDSGNFMVGVGIGLMVIGGGVTIINLAKERSPRYRPDKASAANAERSFRIGRAFFLLGVLLMSLGFALKKS